MIFIPPILCPCKPAFSFWWDGTAIKVELRAAQNVVKDHVSLATATWSTHQATIIHSMRFTPKDAWASVKVLAEGMTSHHKKPIVMRLKLTNGELATNDAENASVMGPHLEKITETTDRLTGKYKKNATTPNALT